jgi:hypothetical protein
MTYAESELVMNRAPVLLSGGAAQDRAAWAQEAAELGGRPLVTVTRLEQLGPALALRSSVLFVPDVLLVGDGGQQLLVRSLTSLDERPKLVLGLSRSEPSARQSGLLREDLHYRLRMGLLNLDAEGMRDAIAARRAAFARRPQRASAPVATGRHLVPSMRPAAAPARSAARPAASRPSRKPGTRKAKARPASRKRPAARVKAARARPKPKKKSHKRR